MIKDLALKKNVDEVIENHLEKFLTRYFDGLKQELNDPNGRINRKINNPFVTSAGKEISFYSAFVRSFESSLGNLIEKIAIELCKKNYIYHNRVSGTISNSQNNVVSSLMVQYKNNSRSPSIAHFKEIDDAFDNSNKYENFNTSDYYLHDQSTDVHHLIELKIGGDLDNKKAEAEKREILQQYCLLKNKLGKETKILTHFATAYNKDGDGKYWKQNFVRQFFAEDELMIGRAFWNFILKSKNGGEIVEQSFAFYAEKTHNYLIELRRMHGLS